MNRSKIPRFYKMTALLMTSSTTMKLLLPRCQKRSMKRKTLVFALNPHPTQKP